MGKLLAEHWPHLIFVAIGVVAFLWTAYRPGREDYGPSSRGPEGYGPSSRGREAHDAAPRGVVALAAAARDASAPSPAAAPGLAPVRPAGTVRRSAARRGLIALGPLLGASATGAILYGINVAGVRCPGLSSGCTPACRRWRCYCRLQDRRRRQAADPPCLRSRSPLRPGLGRACSCLGSARAYGRRALVRARGRIVPVLHPPDHERLVDGPARVARAAVYGGVRTRRPGSAVREPRGSPARRSRCGRR